MNQAKPKEDDQSKSNKLSQAINNTEILLNKKKDSNSGDNAKHEKSS